MLKLKLKNYLGRYCIIHDILFYREDYFRYLFNGASSIVKV